MQNEEKKVIFKPFLKWAGAKTRLTPVLNDFFVTDKKIWAEPFAGSLSVFLNLQSRDNYSVFYLNDANPDLINLYNYIKRDRLLAIKELRTMFADSNNSRDKYNQYRQEFNLTADLDRKSVLFVYLNRHCFNGLCRYNSKKMFNVPFGKYDVPYFPLKELENFLLCIDKYNIVFSNLGYAAFFNSLPNDVLIYCDPPYAPLDVSTFTKYSHDDFTLADQQQLSELANSYSENGNIVILSNHNTVYTQKLYENAKSIKEIEVRRFISANGSRNNAKELIAVFKK